MTALFCDRCASPGAAMCAVSRGIAPAKPLCKSCAEETNAPLGAILSSCHAGTAMCWRAWHPKVDDEHDEICHPLDAQSVEPAWPFYENDWDFDEIEAEWLD